MAKSVNNVITHGLSGKVGDIIVFSQRNGKTIVSKVPKKSTKGPSEKQQAHLRKFQQAIIYAKGAVADATTKEAYAAAAKKGETAYNVAVADLLHAPDIESIDLSKYSGKVGDTIEIEATDDFEVVEVTVAIYNGDGSLVEKGNAALDANGQNWIYTATANNASLVGDKIVVQASDIPGNTTEIDKTLA